MFNVLKKNPYFRYIYGGKLLLENYDDVSDIIEILITANKLGLQELTSHLQSFLIKNKSSWLEGNFNYLVYKTCFKNNPFFELQNFCTKLMFKKPEEEIIERSLTLLIQNNHQMKDIQVWEYVLKWSIAQNPNLPSDPSSYSKDDFNALKNMLQQFIPFIKFYNLTSKEFFDKVLPYKKVLPKELYKDLLKHFFDHNYKPFFDHNYKPEPNDEWKCYMFLEDIFKV